MNKKESILNKIASINIFKMIFSFIKESDFKLKLLKYSKELKIKLDITLFNYPKMYLSKYEYFYPKDEDNIKSINFYKELFSKYKNYTTNIRRSIISNA